MTEVDVLRGPRVTLRAPTLDDAEQLFEGIVSDPQVAHYMSWRPHPDIEETRRVITEIFNVAGETTWLIEWGGDAIGMCGWRHPQPHVRYAVLPNVSPEPQDCLMFAKAVR
ncbi:GNAT family N-acetyltransferase [Mycobacterium sp. B14F4]|uniref:GNAT family N-acetyltransferase n=1 Tax=Mycobacterium sp. B14F4 TaxID=3153565 RepID=UPI00325E98DE